VSDKQPPLTSRATLTMLTFPDEPTSNETQAHTHAYAEDELSTNETCFKESRRG